MTTSERISAILKERGISRRKLAIEAGIPPSSFQSAMERGENFSIKMLMKIAVVLNVDWLELVPENERGDWIAADIIKRAGLTVTDADGNVIAQGDGQPWLKVPLTPKDRVDAAFERLSPEGQRAAAERLEELALLEKYQKKEPSGESNP